ncbi:DUF4231 domain-containing protein [Enterobacter asburiae]|uniref:DUF4231 domain-containing protein n=1 Tax=Enterobacter asburiae TaxID=61645 RepID=UPI001C215C11|nr:DUF4231 domain-containing protein [Enterobacter asburiae]QXB77171.1 DUF4231 domain-containing protein [Enterobacter asburiae]
MLDQESRNLALAEVTHFSSKADHNKNESLFFFSAALFGSLLTPMFFTLGDSVLYSKIIPSLLSALSAFSISWLQLRKPQQLWYLYRSCQREIENLIMKYDYGIVPFDNAECKNAQNFIAQLILVKEKSHAYWSKLTPSPESITSSNNSGK